MRELRTMWAAWLLALGLPGMAAAVEVDVEVVPQGPLVDRVVRDDAHLVLLVTSEHAGDPAPCGCGLDPLGGLARQEAYAQAVRQTGVPTLVLHAGGWLDSTADEGELTPQARAANDAMMGALRGIGVDVLNVGWPDLAGLEAARPGLVSANLLTDEPVLRRVITEVDGRRVLITGVSRGGPAYLQRAPVVGAADGVREVLQLSPDPALAVVLAYDDPQAARSVAQLDGVDLVVEAGAYQARWKPLTDGAVHVRTWDRGQRLTELRLWLGDEGLTKVVVREIPLDARLDRKR